MENLVRIIGPDRENVIQFDGAQLREDVGGRNSEVQVPPAVLLCRVCRRRFLWRRDDGGRSTKESHD
eukprot:1890277-Rhodomonas_salina.3